MLLMICVNEMVVGVYDCMLVIFGVECGWKWFGDVFELEFLELFVFLFEDEIEKMLVGFDVNKVVFDDLLFVELVCYVENLIFF